MGRCFGLTNTSILLLSHYSLFPQTLSLSLTLLSPLLLSHTLSHSPTHSLSLSQGARVGGCFGLTNMFARSFGGWMSCGIRETDAAREGTACARRPLRLQEVIGATPSLSRIRSLTYSKGHNPFSCSLSCLSLADPHTLSKPQPSTTHTLLRCPSHTVSLLSSLSHTLSHKSL